MQTQDTDDYPDSYMPEKRFNPGPHGLNHGEREDLGLAPRTPPSPYTGWDPHDLGHVYIHNLRAFDSVTGLRLAASIGDNLGHLRRDFRANPHDAQLVLEGVLCALDHQSFADLDVEKASWAEGPDCAFENRLAAATEPARLAEHPF